MIIFSQCSREAGGSVLPVGLTGDAEAQRLGQEGSGWEQEHGQVLELCVLHEDQKLPVRRLFAPLGRVFCTATGSG